MAIDKSILAWQETLARYQELRAEATTPRQKSRYTRDINHAIKTIEVFKRLQSQLVKSSMTD